MAQTMSWLYEINGGSIVGHLVYEAFRPQMPGVVRRIVKLDPRFVLDHKIEVEWLDGRDGRLEEYVLNVKAGIYG